MLSKVFIKSLVVPPKSFFGDQRQTGRREQTLNFHALEQTSIAKQINDRGYDERVRIVFIAFYDLNVDIEHHSLVLLFDDHT